MSEFVIGFTCVGRRVQLVRHFRRACDRLGISVRLIGLDTDPRKAAAAYFCDDVCCVPSGDHPDFAGAILDAVARYGIRLLIPLADPDLLPLARIRDEVRRLGCLPAFSSLRTMQISTDKLATHHFLRENNLGTPHTRMLSDVLRTRDASLPLFIKPRTGSAGKHALTIDTWDLPGWIVARADRFVCQDILDGQEVTVDAFIDDRGQSHCPVPRLRLETRGGEVMKSVVRMDPVAIEQVHTIAQALPESFGVINVQGFIQSDGQISWTEINARFGGGSPLAIEAGACYPDMLIAVALGQPPPVARSIRDGMTMLRFDDAIYVDDQIARRGTDIVVPAQRVADPPHSPADRSASRPGV